jgi:hypothetical protein
MTLSSPFRLNIAVASRFCPTQSLTTRLSEIEISETSSVIPIESDTAVEALGRWCWRRFWNGWVYRPVAPGHSGQTPHHYFRMLPQFARETVSLNKLRRVAVIFRRGSRHDLFQRSPKLIGSEPPFRTSFRGCVALYQGSIFSPFQGPRQVL